MPEFKPGDTVRLKSGGPLMTVRSYKERDDLAHCCWFVDQRYDSNSFEPAALEPAAPIRCRPADERPHRFRKAGKVDGVHEERDGDDCVRGSFYPDTLQPVKEGDIVRVQGDRSPRIVLSVDDESGECRVWREKPSFALAKSPAKDLVKLTDSEVRKLAWSLIR